MSTLTGEVVALGWTLLHFFWQSSAIALLYALVDRCSGRASASVRYGIALGSLALMPIVFVATFLEQEKLVSHAHAGRQHFAISQLGTMHTALIEQVPIAGPALSNSELWIAVHANVLLPCLDSIWLAGVLVLALRAADGWWKLQSLRSRASVIVQGPLRGSFDKLAMQYHLRRHVVLRVSDEVISPMVFGIWRTVVLMPLSAVTFLPLEQLEAVLAHELAHVRRWDYLCNLLQTSVECLFFFQPAMWWVSRRVREFREICCDEVAAKVCRGPLVYAEALLHLEEQRAKHMQIAVALHGDSGTLLNRVRRILGENGMEQRSMSGMRMVVIGTVLAVLFVTPHMAHGNKAESQERLQLIEATTPTQPKPVASVLAPGSTIIAPPTGVATAAVPEPIPMPKPDMREASVATPMPTPILGADADPSAEAGKAASQQSNVAEYVLKMRDAGYPLDLNKDFDQVVRLRLIGVTPEFAKAMAQTSLGTPTFRDLVTLKSLGVTPDYITSFGRNALAPDTFQDIATAKSLGITPDYASSFVSLGLGKPTFRDVVTMRSTGVTADYVASLKGSGIPPADLREAASMRAVGVTPEYASAMAAAGYPGLKAHDLISLRAQGMTPEYAKWLKATFPDADSQAMRQVASFHIDADFVAKAKANGFTDASLDKLTRLKMSGLLN